MLTLVIGGAASGKSAYAEELAVKAAAAREKEAPEYAGLFYIATMHRNDRDPETVQRIKKHRRERAGKGFETIEQEAEMEALALKAGSTALLEDLSNLLANEMFFAGRIPFESYSPETEEKIRMYITEPLRKLAASGTDLVIVTNQIAEDSMNSYDPVTGCFIAGLQQLNRELGKQADRIYEVVCGIPICCGGKQTERK